MDIQIKVDANEVLGGPEYRPYLELKLIEAGEATLSMGERHSSRNGTTFDVWHGRLEWRTRLSQGSYTLPDVSKIEAIAGRVKPLLDRVHAGHSTHWNGSNYKCRLTDDAQEASDEIKRIFENADWCDENRHVRDACEWMAAAGFLKTAKEFGLTVNTGAAAWTAAEAAVVEQAANDGVVLAAMDKATECMKEALQEEAEARLDERGGAY
jgi:hypothetical protein